MAKHKQIIDYWSIPKDWPHLYRAEAFGTGDEVWDGGVQIHIRKIQIVKYTASGVWVSQLGMERFVNLRAMKQWASITEREAKVNLMHRKRRQIQITKYNLEVAELAYEQLKKELTP